MGSDGPEAIKGRDQDHRGYSYMKKELRHRGRMISVSENIVDKVIRYFDPVRSNKRFQARIIGAIAGGYTGARTDRRATSQWATRGGDPDSDILFDLPTLRERSRDLVRNNPLATGAINTVCTNVVGTGIRLQARIDREVLGMSEEEFSQLEGEGVI